MGRGARPRVRWAKERMRAKRRRDKRIAEQRGEARKAAPKSA